MDLTVMKRYVLAVFLITVMSCSNIVCMAISSSESMQAVPFHTTDSKPVGSIFNPAWSCNEVKKHDSTVKNGIYFLKDTEGNVFQTYCDMVTAGGGWTLVASVHENSMKGRCTSGDRWSSEQGNSPNHPHGDGFWENRATYGTATSASSDDYKNSAYFTMKAKNLMIWRVENDATMEHFSSKAFLKFHTYNDFLSPYGGNLGSLFSRHFNMRSQWYHTNVDNGPAIPIQWDTGSDEVMLSLLGFNVRKEVEPGYVQFRAINYQRSAFALCPGVKMKPGMGSVEHVCMGSTSNNIGHTHEEQYCGDFAASDWSHGDGWSSSQKLIDSVIMMFYK